VISQNIFDQNVATMTNYGVAYLQSEKLLVSQTTFTKSNIFNAVWKTRLMSNQFANTDAERFFFQVKSNGANLYINAFTTVVTACTFSEATSIGGSGAYILTLGTGYVLVSYSTFTSMMNSLEYAHASTGGALLIDSSTSELDLNIDNVLMKGCEARL
jgi:hypothetical protein